MNRKELLTKLINMDTSVESLNLELNQFGWDSGEDLIILKKWHVLKILNKFVRGWIKQTDVTTWAEAIECREDIGFEVPYEKLIGEIIFELANPDVTGTLSEGKAKALIEKLA